MIFLHPVHNYALVAYDPSALGVAGASAVRAAELLPGQSTIPYMECLTVYVVICLVIIILDIFIAYVYVH